MTNGQPNTLLKHIHKLVAAQAFRNLSDRALLDSWIVRRDEAAFAALVERHGSMILAVCRRVLRRLHDAEDACQATFLVLARKAGSIRKKDSLSSWLHGVAFRVASDLKKRDARKQNEGKSIDEVPGGDTVSEVTWQEAQVVLDEELNRLPESYRAPLVLCYLEGRARDEAAQQLGWNARTLRSRLERGRELLRSRLLRRGIAPSIALLSAVFAETASATMPATLSLSTVKAATSVATEGFASVGLISTKVAALTEGVIKAMCLTKLKTAAVVVLAVMLASTGVGTLTYRTLAGDQPSGTPAASTGQTPAAADAARIPKLIDQLGSATFADRERAAKELDKIGVPALDALRKAARDADLERKRRAEELVQKIEKRTLEATLLAPTRVHLVYKDTPLAEAVTDFHKQSGYAVALSDPEGKLKGRTVTLDTGDVTFWQAFDQFCRKSGLIESPPQPAEAADRGELPPLPYPRLPGQHADQQQGAVRPGGAARKGSGIILTDGKPVQMPTDDSTAVRVRAKVGVKIANGSEFLLTVQITPEPKLHRVEIAAVRIKRAIDNTGQSLEPVLGGNDLAAPPVKEEPLPPLPYPRSPSGPAGSVRHDPGLVRLKSGITAATSLSELSGTITLRVLQGPGSASKVVTLDMPFTLKNVSLP